VPVALGIQQAVRMRHIVRLYTFFPHYLTNGTILEKSYKSQNVCFDFFYNIYLKNFSF
jgi:hypothetical protein